VQSGIRDAHHWPFAYNAARPETHRDPDQEIASLNQRLAENDARVQALTKELERLKEQSSSNRHMTSEEHREIQSAIDTTERMLDDTMKCPEPSGQSIQ
jgi:hypothetical protein